MKNYTIGSVPLCKNVVKVVKVILVIFIFGFGHLLTIYKYKIFIIVADFDTWKTILTKMTMTKMTAEKIFYRKQKKLMKVFVNRNGKILLLQCQNKGENSALVKEKIFPS